MPNISSLLSVAALAAASLFAGCATFAPQVDKAASATRDAIERYCREFTQQQREEFRAKVNTGSDTVVVTCQGDQ